VRLADVRNWWKFLRRPAPPSNAAV
jgi:hypothetical protein